MTKYFDEKLIEDAQTALFAILAATVFGVGLSLFDFVRRRYYDRLIERKLNRDGFIPVEELRELERKRPEAPEWPDADGIAKSLFGIVFTVAAFAIAMPVALAWFEDATGTSSLRPVALGFAGIAAWSGYKLYRDGPEEEIIGYDGLGWTRDPYLYWFAAGFIVVMVIWSLL